MRLIDETWTATGFTLFRRTSENAGVSIAQFRVDEENRNEEERARLAAHAPEMARLLLKQYETACEQHGTYDPEPCLTREGVALFADILKRAGVLP